MRWPHRQNDKAWGQRRYASALWGSLRPPGRPRCCGCRDRRRAFGSNILRRLKLRPEEVSECGRCEPNQSPTLPQPEESKDDQYDNDGANNVDDLVHEMRSSVMYGWVKRWRCLNPMVHVRQYSRPDPASVRCRTETGCPTRLAGARGLGKVASKAVQRRPDSVSEGRPAGISDVDLNATVLWTTRGGDGSRPFAGLCWVGDRHGDAITVASIPKTELFPIPETTVTRKETMTNF